MSESDDGETTAQFPTGGALDVLGAAVQAGDVSQEKDQQDPLIGASFGSYQIIKLIATGGMGRVYRAQRQDGQFAREVAVKVLPSGGNEELVQRFIQERDILASLNHPHIAQLYDAGIADSGHLFLVMELIEGLPIDQHCEKSGLTINQRVRLVQQLCQALGYAHGKLVLHRDIKPSNVMVANDGTLKLLDFGIAKLVSADTTQTQGSAPMSPAFASPEQLLGGQVSIASDVYQTGSLLYLLATGHLPHAATSIGERISQLTQAKPAKLGSEFLQLPRDLQLIIQGSLSTEDEDRYPDINALAMDFERYLNGYTVLIKPPKLAVVVKKWLQRNTAAAISTASLLLVLVASTVWYTISLSQSQQLAEREAMVANQTKDLLIGLFRSGDPWLVKNEKPTVLDVIRSGIEELNTANIEDPEIHVQLLLTLAEVLQNLGEQKEAIKLIERARKILSDSLPNDYRLIFNSTNMLANYNVGIGEYEAAESIFNSLLSNIDTDAYQGRAKAVALNGMAVLQLRRGNYQRAMAYAQRAVTHALQTLGQRHHVTLMSQNSLADIYNSAGQPELAIELINRVRPISEDTLGLYHENAMSLTLNLGVAFYQQGDTAQAAPLLADVRERSLVVYGADHPKVVRDTVNLAILYSDTGRFDEAQSLFAEAIGQQQDKLGPNHPMTLRYRLNYTTALVVNERWSDALAVCRTLAPAIISQLGANHQYGVEVRRDCAMAQHQAGDRQRGATELRQVVADMQRVFGANYTPAAELAEQMQRMGVAP